MTGPNDKIVIEFSVREAIILSQSILHYNPPQDDEMIAMMLYARIARKIDEARLKK
jgi:uncharacterized protein YneF (UPF0154 family)